MYYCWTHGLGTNPSHTGTTCNNRADGHKEEANADNTMGGSNKIMTRNRMVTPRKRSRTSHPHLQESLRSWTVQRQQRFSAPPLGQTHPTSRIDTQTAPKLPPKPKTIRMVATEWNI